MLIINPLKRVFIHKENGLEVRLADPGEQMPVEAVQFFYSNTYPILVNARSSGPHIENDEMVYRFESTMGTKG